MQTDAWIHSMAVVLGSILAANIVGIMFWLLVQHSMSEVFAALGFVAGASLGKLLISPLNGSLLE